MKFKVCTYCGNECWHTPTSTKYQQNDGQWRCTKCGYPPSTNSFKRDAAEVHMRRVAKRLA